MKMNIVHIFKENHKGQAEKALNPMLPSKDSWAQ